jgi:aminoglycoside phosphotransferase (APT) family kinase protein
MEITTANLHHLLQQFAPGAGLAKWWSLDGGFSAQMTAMDVRLPSGESRTVVARLHGPRDTGINPDVALDHYRLLQTLSSTRLPVPRALHLDQTCEAFDQPVLVLEYVEGSTDIGDADIKNAMPQMAEMLARIHKIDPVAHDLKFLRSEQEMTNARLAHRPQRPDDELQEAQIRSALERAGPITPRNPPTLLHGDYWSGNLIWMNKEIVAVIDWENAIIGDPVEDVANARMEIFWQFGKAAMDKFTREYQSMSNADFAMLARWDLIAALRPTGRLDDWVNTAEERRILKVGHAGFVKQAIETIDL